MIQYLTIDEILRLHYQVIKDFGGSHGVRDEGRIKSVLLAPQQEVFGAEQYPTIHEKAAVYLCNIIGDHPFSDGNKRTGITVAGVFLMRNGIRLTATPQSLEDFAVRVATDHLEISVITAWFETHSSAQSK